MAKKQSTPRPSKRARPAPVVPPKASTNPRLMTCWTLYKDAVRKALGPLDAELNAIMFAPGADPSAVAPERIDALEAQLRDFLDEPALAGAPPFRFGRGFIGDYARGINPNAEIADVVLAMFKSAQDDDTISTFADAVMASTIDDLALMDLAHDSDSTAESETQRQIERIRWRLLASKWLDAKAGKPELTQR